MKPLWSLLTHFPLFFHRTNIFSAIKWSSTSSDAFKLRKTYQDSRNYAEAVWLFHKSKTIMEESWHRQNIAKLHYMFLKCLKIFSSSRVNPFKEVYIFMLFEFSLSLWLLLPFNAFMRTADCISYRHLQENTSFFLQILGYSKVIMINDFIFYVEQNCTCVFWSYFNAGTCLDRILCQYLLCKSYYTVIAHCLR